MTNRIEIWQPKYSTDNEIVFTKAPHLKEKVFTMSGDRIRSFKRQPNGRGEVYCVPMKELTEK